MTFDKDEVNINRPLGMIEAKVIAASEDVVITDVIKDSNIVVVDIPEGQGLMETMETLGDNENISAVQPNYLYEVL